MQAYTKRFLGGTGQLRATSSPVPAGKLWVVRCADFTPGSATAVDVYLGVAGGWSWFETHLDPAAGPKHVQWQGRQVLNAGEILQVYATADVVYMVTGYELGA